MSDMLHIKSASLNLEKNKLAHHTSDYISNQLIVRKGQVFEIGLILNRSLRAEDTVTFFAETGRLPHAGNNTKVSFPLSTSEIANGKWKAVSNSETSNAVTVSITAPVTAIIGSYKLTVQMFSGGYTSHMLGRFILLFNPWAIDDDVYVAEELERKEYVLSDSTIIYCGSEDYIQEIGWNLGQFEEDILKICLLILEKQKLASISLLNDPKQVSRICSAMVNSNDDRGILQGNWSGSYFDGKNPKSWTGSVNILRNWAASGPVRYGQCWVFAGVLCTVLRCLGIPSRIVTNFSSAHDTDEDLSIDYFYDPDGKRRESADSIWNFHVWNEVWFTREDIGSYYDGWQAVDATPQEKSQGIYRLGPVSVKAIKTGDVHLKFDGPFVFSEMNADLNSWIYQKHGETFERIKTVTNAIGKFTSTKAVGTDKRLDITSNYKYDEGTAEEREAYHHALVCLFGKQPVAEANTNEPNILARIGRARPVYKLHISGKFKESEPPLLGQDIEVTLVLSNEALSHKTIQIIFSAGITGYTRRVIRHFLNETVSITMASKEEKETPFKIPYSRYITNLLHDNVVEVTALCKADDAEKLLVSKVITLKTPSLDIQVHGDAVVHNPLHVDVKFINPLNEMLTDCEVHAEGSGLIKGHIKKIISVEPNEEIKVSLDFTPYTKGSKRLQVVVSCHRSVTIQGHKRILVKSCETIAP